MHCSLALIHLLALILLDASVSDAAYSWYIQWRSKALRGPGSLNRLNPRFLRHWVHCNVAYQLIYQDLPECTPTVANVTKY